MTAASRADYEAAIIDDRGLGRWLASVGLDGSTRDGTNKALLDPLRRALADAGFRPGVLALVPADFEAVASASTLEVLDRATLATYEAVRDAWDRGEHRPAPVQPGSTPETPEERQMRYRRLLGIIEDLRERLKRKYGEDAGNLTAGVIDLDFAAAPCGEF